MTDISLFGSTTRALAAASSMLVMLTVLPAFAQPAGCDEGVIRLPDRNGTIQICSALAAQVPQLSRQLTEATRALGNQQTQIQELTKLVRGLNSAGQGLDATRQAAMLKNLSSELTRSQRGGDAQVQRSVQSLNEQLDVLRDQLATMVGNAAAATAAQQALRGEVGDSIAKLEFGSAARQLDDISLQIKALQGQVGDVRQDTKATLDLLRRREQEELADRSAAEGEKRKFYELPQVLANVQAIVFKNPFQAHTARTEVTLFISTLREDMKWEDVRLLVALPNRGQWRFINATELLVRWKVGGQQTIKLQLPPPAQEFVVCVSAFDPYRQQRMTVVHSLHAQDGQPTAPSEVLPAEGESRCVPAGSQRIALETVR